jgi:hypothetical protein
MGPAAGYHAALGARLVQEGTGCTIWLTGPASPAVQ